MAKLTTMSEFAREQGISIHILSGIIKNLKLKTNSVIFEDTNWHSKVKVLPVDTENKLRDYFFQKELECNIEERKERAYQMHPTLPENIEELKRLHPEITDVRCFVEDWFPDVEIY